MTRNKAKKPPREGFRPRINPWNSGMNRRQMAAEIAKDTARWLVVTVLAYGYWLALLLIFSIFLLNIWKVSLVQILIYSGVLCAITSVVYAYILVHRKLYY